LLEEVDIDGNKPVKFFTYNRIVDSFGVITDQYDNNAYVWGLNQDGKLSIGDRIGEVLQYPERVTGFTGKTITKVLIDGDEKSTTWLTDSGDVLTCGSAEDYVSGRTNGTDTSTAQLIEYSDSEDIIDIHFSYRSRWLVKDNNSASSMGIK